MTSPVEYSTGFSILDRPLYTHQLKQHLQQAMMALSLLGRRSHEGSRQIMTPYTFSEKDRSKSTIRETVYVLLSRPLPLLVGAEPLTHTPRLSLMQNMPLRLMYRIHIQKTSPIPSMLRKLMYRTHTLRLNQMQNMQVKLCMKIQL